MNCFVTEKDLRYNKIEDHVGNIKDIVDALEVIASGLGGYDGKGAGAGALRAIAAQLSGEAEKIMNILFPNNND